MLPEEILGIPLRYIQAQIVSRMYFNPENVRRASILPLVFCTVVEE